MLQFFQRDSGPAVVCDDSTPSAFHHIGRGQKVIEALERPAPRRISSTALCWRKHLM